MTIRRACCTRFKRCCQNAWGRAGVLVRLPVPPSTNNLFVNLAKGGRATSKRYADWQTQAGWVLRQRPQNSFGQMQVEVKIWVPRSNRRDVDNFAKGILDLLTKHKVYNDDRQVQRLTIERHDDKEALVEVMPFSESASPERRIQAAGYQ